MKEKRKKEKHLPNKKHKSKRRSLSASSSSSKDSDEWVEKNTTEAVQTQRDDWMSMTGMLKTYSKDDIKPKRDKKEKQHINSYNPATSGRELNPYWKDGGLGLPQTPEDFLKSKPFARPMDDDDDYYSKSLSKSNDYHMNKPSTSSYKSYEQKIDDYNIERDNDSYSYKKSYNWKKHSETVKRSSPLQENNLKSDTEVYTSEDRSIIEPKIEKHKDDLYLSDEKMNKLAAKIVKAEIMGDIKLVNELKTKLEAAREYRKQNPNAANHEQEEVLLTSTNNMGNSRPLPNPTKGDTRSKGGKRKADTHNFGERIKYFGNDDKYNLSQMFQQEKYGDSYNDEAELAKIAAKHRNPNDDLEDIFTDEISKNRNEAKTDEAEKQKAINQHKKVARSLEGCEYCVDSKYMLKHLMVDCSSKVYLALPARTSLVKGHCIITTVQHFPCVTSLDEDFWEEIQNYRKTLTQFFNSQNKDVVFYETATKLHRYPHMVINCVPIPRDVGDMAAIYFKKALLECEAEWSMNKKIVDLKGRDIRKGVPKGLPYFWIDFGMDPGFAHVIEDQQLFPKTFAEEIIAGILDLDHSLWKNPRKEYGELQRKKVVEFIKEWKSFEAYHKQS